MSEEEKKAIEILDTFELRRKTKNYKEISLEDSQSIKIVLNLIEKLQKENELAKQALINNCNIADERNQLLKENEELKIKHDKDTHKLQNDLDIANAKIIELKEAYISAQACANMVFDKVIPIQKVKDKIEELKQERISKYDEYMGYKIESREQQDIDKKTKILQELIEEREEK